MGECLTFTSKSACLMILATLCITLVIWTVIETSQKPEENVVGLIKKANMTYSGHHAVCAINSSLSIDHVSLALTSTYQKYFQENDGELITTARLKTKQVTLTKDKRTLCKCLCDRNVTNNDLLEAIQHIKRNKANRY